jgi:glycine cleavage system H protein
VENLSVQVLYAEGKAVQVELPASVSLKVVESPEGLRGDTASNVTKPAKLETGKSFGNVESVKAVSEIYAPAAGEVTEANGELANKPELLNSDPHGAGWLVKVKLANAAELSGLMDGPAYEAYIAQKGKEASA